MTLPYSAIRASVYLRAIGLCALFFVLLTHSAAQVSPDVLVEAPTESDPNASLLIAVELLHGENVERVNLQYRSFGRSEYTRLEMDLRGNRASAVIPASDVLAPFVEYYLVLESRLGTLEAYPLSEGGNPYSQPPQKTLQIAVRNKSDQDDQIIFLSPEPGGLIPGDEVLISVSLLRSDSLVDRKATQLFLDGANVSAQALFNDDLIVYVPENFALLKPGKHTLAVSLYDNNGKPYRSRSMTFGTSESGGGISTAPPAIRYLGSIQLESRFERITGRGSWFNRGNVILGADIDGWRAHGNLFLTSDESAVRQPQNRYFFGLESSWLRAGYGDGFPSFPDLVLSGKRVRGLHSSLELGFFNIDMTLGKTVRGIEGQLLKAIPLDSLGVEQQRDPDAAYAPLNQQTWGKFSYGTYERELFAIRPSFGSGETWQLGFTWLKSKDALSSIKYGTRPQENLVVGSDVVVRLLNDALVLSGQGAFSAFNSDISSGSFTDAYIDSVYTNDADDIRRVRDILDDFITVNDNLRPLSLKRLATVAYEVGMRLELFDNSIKATYLYRGSEYNSFGQSFMRKDIRGFNIVDRLRMAGNQLLLTLGYERLEDNTSKTKRATTVYSNINTAVSYYPGMDFPSFTLGYSYFANDNDLLLNDPEVTDERTNRVYIQSSYGFHLGVRHSLNIGYSSSVRDDRSVRELDIKNSTLGVGISTQFPIPLETRIDYNLNLNRIPANFDYSTLLFSGRYLVVKDAVTIFSSVSPTFGDIRRLLVSFGSEWVVHQSVTILLDYSYFHPEVGVDDVIWGARLRYEL